MHQQPRAGEQPRAANSVSRSRHRGRVRGSTVSFMARSASLVKPDDNHTPSPVRVYVEPSFGMIGDVLVGDDEARQIGRPFDKTSTCSGATWSKRQIDRLPDETSTAVQQVDETTRQRLTDDCLPSSNQPQDSECTHGNLEDLVSSSLTRLRLRRERASGFHETSPRRAYQVSTSYCKLRMNVVTAFESDASATRNCTKRKRPLAFAKGLFEDSRRRPTLPHSLPCSTIGAGGLNCSVRNGKRCFPSAVATGISLGASPHGTSSPSISQLNWVDGLDETIGHLKVRSSRTDD